MTLLSENAFVWGDTSAGFRGTVEITDGGRLYINGEIRPFNERFGFEHNTSNPLTEAAKEGARWLAGPGTIYKIEFVGSGVPVVGTFTINTGFFSSTLEIAGPQPSGAWALDGRDPKNPYTLSTPRGPIKTGYTGPNSGYDTPSEKGAKERAQFTSASSYGYTSGVPTGAGKTTAPSASKSSSGGNYTGGLGNDTYVVDNVGDTIVENANDGVDTVQTNLTSYILGGHGENLISTTTTAFSGTGNSLDNLIVGGRYAHRWRW